MNRDKFEALPEIKSRLISVNFNERLGRYESRSPVVIECFEAALYLNGAYYAFCEQEERIEEIKSKVQDVWTELDDRQSKEHIIERCEEIIRELLK